MTQEMREAICILLGAAAVGLPLLGALVAVMQNRSRWERLAERQDRKIEELVRWLANNCKQVGDFERRGDNVIHFRPRGK